MKVEYMALLCISRLETLAMSAGNLRALALNTKLWLVAQKLPIRPILPSELETQWAGKHGDLTKALSH